MSDIAYQNKDIVSKIFGHGLKEKSLEVYGIPMSRVVNVLPVNLPAIEASELSTDNLFELEDHSVALIDYESQYTELSKVKYINHIARFLKRYGAGRNVRMIVLYTCNVRNINPMLDVGCLKLTIEPGYLSKIHMDTVLTPIADKIQRGERLTDQELMLLVILPLTKQKKSAQRAALKEIVELAKQIADEDQQLFAISGALTFADKIVDSKYANQVKEWIMMTKVARLFEEEKMEAVRRVEMEKDAALEKANIEKLQTLQALKKAQQEKLALKLLLKGQSPEEISAKTGLPIAALNQIKN